MDDDRWRRISRLYHDALARDPAETDDFLREACADDPELRAEVRELLDADPAAVDAIGDKVAEAAAEVARGVHEGTRIGPYRVIRETGTGGMGRVFLAERADGEFEQVVALKVVRADLGSDVALQRFRQERQILAGLQHPNIARLLDGGVTADGQPYFALEYVEGEPIDAYCDRKRLTIAERLELFLDVCRALAYAHANLVVHRDLKPDNILATEDGAIRLLDFGIAKVLAEQQAGPAATRTAMWALTPAYASPEQVRGEAVGTATDVYSLGVVLYELLTGSRPYDVEDPRPAEVERVVSEVVPERPSTRVGRASPSSPEGRALVEARRTDAVRLRKRLSGDLDVICLKALRKEPGQRYGSVEALLQDIERHLEARPVLARPATLRYRLGRAVRRNRLAVGAAATVVVTSATLVAFYTARLADERDRAQVEAATASEVAAFLQGLFEVADPSESLGETVTARELLDAGARRIDEGLAGQPEVQATMLRVIGEVYAGLGLPAEARPLLERSLALSEELYGDTHEDVALAKLSLAQALQDLGDLDAAEPLYHASLATFRRALGPDDPRTSEALERFAYWLETDGDYEAAEAEYRLALSQLRRSVADDDARVVSVVASLGNLLRQLDRLDEAEPLLREALEKQRALYGPRHPDVASTARTLAALLRDQGRFAQSDSLYQEVLAIRREILGERHPEVANTLNSYAILLDRMGEQERAIAAYREFLSILQAIYDEPHPSVAAAYHNLALSLRDAGELDEAEELFGRAIAEQDLVFRPDHPNRAFPRIGLASIHRERGRPDLAEPLLREALAVRRGALPAGHRYIGEALSDLGASLVDMSRLDEAEPLLLEAYDVLLEAEGAEGGRTVRARARLADLYHRAGDEEEAARYRDGSGR